MTEPSAEFCTFSARLGQDPLRVQGPGGNTSIKLGDIMWIKASGTELADADTKPIFVAVDRAAAKAEAAGEGDGSCKNTVIDPANTLRPSIETTFHAALDWPVVAHTHSIATLVHAISPEGREVAADKLVGLPVVFVPYAKPGLPLTREILARVTAETQIVVLENHGLICCGNTVDEANQIMQQVEDRLKMPVLRDTAARAASAMDGFEAVTESWMAHDAQICALALGGSYYPDHVVFLGPALPTADHNEHPRLSSNPDKASTCATAPHHRNAP
ncbi:class II aldolase/adducin family protein [Yoonia sp. GPGPB17]|uniref:class II aldolase/adducin family protein n=1 Tax=Yoonia sp. GPGPB17 TaxID=3026147 RepID=UPI0030C2AF33